VHHRPHLVRQTLCMCRPLLGCGTTRRQIPDAAVRTLKLVLVESNRCCLVTKRPGTCVTIMAWIAVKCAETVLLRKGVNFALVITRGRGHRKSGAIPWKPVSTLHHRWEAPRRRRPPASSKPKNASPATTRRPSLTSGGRWFLNKLRNASADQRRPATPALWPPVLPPVRNVARFVRHRGLRRRSQQPRGSTIGSGARSALFGRECLTGPIHYGSTRNRTESLIIACTPARGCQSVNGP
jgi:hypothetical protein